VNVYSRIESLIATAGNNEGTAVGTAYNLGQAASVITNAAAHGLIDKTEQTLLEADVLNQMQQLKAFEVKYSSNFGGHCEKS